MKTKALKLIAVGAALALTLVACTDNGVLPPPPSPSPTSGDPLDTSSPEVATETAAAELRAAVGSLLQSHAYLLGVVTAELFRTDSESEELVGAQATLDDNTSALTEIIAEAYGDDAGGRFSDLWRSQVGYVTDYARGIDEGNPALRDGMEQELLGFRDRLGLLLDELTDGAIPATTGTASFEPYYESQLAVVDAQAAGGDVAGALRETAGRLPEIADLLAGAIVAGFPDRYRDSIDVPAARLRSSMWSLFQEQAFLVWMGVKDLDPTSALAANGEALADAWAEHAGRSSREPFLRLLDERVQLLRAAAAGDTTVAPRLGQWRERFAALVVSDVKGTLEVGTVIDELEVADEELLQALAARLADTRQQTDLLRGAIAQMPVLADVLATGLVQAYPETFAPEV